MEDQEELETGEESGILVEVKTATQGSYLPFTALPRHYAGKTVRLVIVDDDETIGIDLARDLFSNN